MVTKKIIKQTNLLTQNQLIQDTTYDKILTWYIDETGKLKLTEKQEDLKSRWEAAYDLLCNYHSPQQATPLLMQQFGLSKAQAYRDVKNATNLFGDINETRKEGIRHILYEYAMKTFQMAAKSHDYAEMNRAIANMIKLKGLDKDDPDLPDFSRLVPTTQVIQINPEFLQKYGHLIDQSVIEKLKKVFEKKIVADYKDIIEVPFTEIKDE